jgi:hypothetical protein
MYALPAPHRWVGQARLAHDRIGSGTAPRQHDLGSLHDLLRGLAIGNEPLQCRPIAGPDVQACLDIPNAAPSTLICGIRESYEWLKTLVYAKATP